MSRLILVPQFPTKMRYQEWFINEFSDKFKKYFDEIIILGDEYIQNYDNKLYLEFAKSPIGMFSPIEHAIALETCQISEYNDMKLKPGDILLLNDLSFPGLFSNILYHKHPRKVFCYCHATSLNYLDYFENDRDSKFLIETGNSMLFNKVFVGSKYHKRKLNWKNTKVIGLPIPNFEFFKEEKIYDIISVARLNNQKIDKKIEDLVEKDFSKVIRKECNSWEEYYKFLSQAKILLITSKEDTFNYSVLEAIKNNTIVLTPNKLSFPELLPREFLYDNYQELKLKIEYYLNNYKKVPKLLNNELCERFYENLAKEMLD